jgi:hypothetical protein
MTVSLVTQRVIHNTTDISVSVSDSKVNTYAMTYTPGQYFYIGSSCPFNNIWLELSTPSVSTAGAVVVEVWNGTAWVATVDVIDQTTNMRNSGRISWTLEINTGWPLEQYSTTVGLSGTSIYNRYWLRMSWPIAFTTSISYVGQKFSSDSLMSSIYPDLMKTAILSGFQTGKTNWDDQHFMASEAIIKEIRKRNIALDRGQMMDWSVFEDAGCHRVAEIAYQAFGAPYVEHANRSRKRYNEELNTRFMVIDSNADGHLTEDEALNKSGWMTR